MARRSVPSARDSFGLYLDDIGKHRLVTVEEEQRLARAYASGDTHAGHALITANLRFVVRVANEYRSYGLSVSDLVQEGNLGLLRALQRFDAGKGIRFLSYAVWWIRAYMQSYIVRSFSLVKLGTTQAQRKLFFALARTRRELDRYSVEHGADSDGEDAEKVARRLGVKPSEVDEMTRRMAGRDCSLDAPVGEDGDLAHVDLVPHHDPLQDEALSAVEERHVRHRAIDAALEVLDVRERFIVEQRLLADRPVTLLEIAEHFSFSRERARQLELRAKTKLRKRLQELGAEPGPGPEEAAFLVEERAIA